MLYRIIIFLSAMAINVGYPTTANKSIPVVMYNPDGVHTMISAKDILAARAKVGETTHAANDTLFGQFQMQQASTATYNFNTYVTSPRCDSLKVYINGTKVYQYNYTVTGFKSHSFTFTPNVFDNTIKFVTIYGDTLAGSWYLENKSIRQ